MPHLLHTFESMPIDLRHYLSGDSRVSVIKEKTRASVYLIEQENAIYLKITPKGELHHEAEMTRYLSGCGVCAKVLLYVQDDQHDYLVTEQVKGKNAAEEEYLEQPERLCEAFAESLVRLHTIGAEDCPRDNRLQIMVERAIGNFRDGKADRSLLRYVGYESRDEAYKELLLLEEHAESDDRVIIHGDYCLPNLILNEFEFSGYVDVGYGGSGDRHYDLFWALWSLQFNLKSSRYSERFIDAYGRDKVDEDLLRLCGIVSVFNGFRGQDYYD
ncbi:aminoglycoside 3'-phosphotransferase [Paenibacillus sp. J2TS4]|uniref:aminoglycoside 3'-phosphotransferase n=1 Tax=Paenibacillus sp. J2TS4 TaxID=2807194 RepID=UPI001B2EDAB5|nr:aminoglycoside 3'-phosphotransferase [Paenibacillus sp. J2TS4]GIP31585.1 aminoglycoside phosphotransferase APH(3') [Paenibacillus sp. J2TS4]